VVAEHALSPTRDMTRNASVRDAAEESRFGRATETSVA
jgi:hypothetical protein